MFTFIWIWFLFQKKKKMDVCNEGFFFFFAVSEYFSLQTKPHNLMDENLLTIGVGPLRWLVSVNRLHSRLEFKRMVESEILPLLLLTQDVAKWGLHGLCVCVCIGIDPI